MRENPTGSIRMYHLDVYIYIERDSVYTDIDIRLGILNHIDLPQVYLKPRWFFWDPRQKLSCF